MATDDVEEMLGVADADGEMVAGGEDDPGETMMLEVADDEGDPREQRTPLVRVGRLLEAVGYEPRINLTARYAHLGVKSDREIVAAMLDEILAIEAPKDTRRALVAMLRREREKRGIAPGELLDAGPRAERILRTLAHAILSLPEAQLG